MSTSMDQEIEGLKQAVSRFRETLYIQPTGNLMYLQICKVSDFCPFACQLALRVENSTKLVQTAAKRVF